MGRGRSAAGGGGNATIGGPSLAWSSEVDAMKSEFDAMKDNRKALFLTQNGFLSRDDALQHMRDGDIDKYGSEYFELLKENGDYTPKGKVSTDNGNMAQELVNSGEYSGIEDARKALIQRETGMNSTDAETTYAQMDTWFGSRWEQADTTTLDRFVAKAPVYDGTIYRGMHFETAQELDNFAGNLKTGDRITMNGKNSSWTNDESVAVRFAHRSDETYSSAMITCLKNKTSVPVNTFSSKNESEVLASSKAQWTVLRKEVTVLPNGNKKLNIFVVEADNG